MPWWRRAARPPWYEQPPQVELPRGRRRLSAADAGPDELHNLALAVVLQWGPTRRIPPAQRLASLVDGLDSARAEELVAQAKAAERVGGAWVWNNAVPDGKSFRFPPMQQLRAVLSEFAWIDGDNLSHLYSQACRDVVHG